jgi:hypothetical protein
MGGRWALPAQDAHMKDEVPRFMAGLAAAITNTARVNGH